MGGGLVQPSAMPQQQITPLQPGANSPGQSAGMIQQQQIQAQLALTGKKVGGKNKGVWKGGAAQIIVPNPPPNTGGSQTQASYTALTSLAQAQQQGGIYDNAQNPEQTARIQAQNNRVYSGGMKWGCLSGGKHKSKKRNTKHRNTKHRNTKHRNTKHRNTKKRNTKK